MEFCHRHYKQSSSRLGHLGISWHLLACCVFLQFCLFSDAYSDLGVPLPVDAYSRVEGGMVEVRIGNSARVVPEAKANLYVIDRYLDSRLLDQRLDIQALEEFLVRDHQMLSSEELGRLLALLLRQVRYQGESQEELLSIIRMHPDATDVLKSLFESYSGSVPARTELYEFLFLLVMKDPVWVIQDLGDKVRGDRFRDFLLQKYRVLAKQGDFAEASQLVDLVGVLFGEESASHRALLGLSGKVSGSRHLLEQDTVQDLILLMRRVREDREVGSLLDELTLQRVHQKSEKLIDANQSSSALTLLSEVALSERTPTTLRLLKRAAMELQVQEGDSALFLNNNFQIVKEMSEGSYAVRERVLAYLRSQLDEYLAKRNFDSALHVFRLIQELRSDPHRENDSIRFAISLAYLADGRRSAAESMLQERQSSYSLSELIALSREGYFSQRLIGSLFLLITLVGVLTLTLLRSRARSRAEAFSDREDEDRESFSEPQISEARRSRGFERVAIKQGLDPRIQEYRLLLHRLGVGPEADINVIKATYRQKLKQLHPDLQNNQGTGNREEFYRLKETYEKIMNIRELLELKSDSD